VIIAFPLHFSPKFISLTIANHWNQWVFLHINNHPIIIYSRSMSTTTIHLTLILPFSFELSPLSKLKRFLSKSLLLQPPLKILNILEIIPINKWIPVIQFLNLRRSHRCRLLLAIMIVKERRRCRWCSEWWCCLRDRPCVLCSQKQRLKDLQSLHIISISWAIRCYWSAWLLNVMIRLCSASFLICNSCVLQGSELLLLLLLWNSLIYTL